MLPKMARNGVKKTLLASSLSFFKNLYIFVTIKILFLFAVLHTSYVVNKKPNSHRHDHELEELEDQEPKTNRDKEEEEDEEGLIEIALVRDAKEENLENVKKYYEEMMIMEIWEEIEEGNLIEIDLSMGSIVLD